MIKNLSEYFLDEYEFYLQKVSYDKMDNDIDDAENRFQCEDNFQAEVIEQKCVKLIVTRIIRREPAGIFELSVSFGAILTFNPEKIDEYDWHSINVAEEFKLNGDFVIGNLMSRISLLIAEITASFGQPPIILPPIVAK